MGLEGLVDFGFEDWVRRGRGRMMGCCRCLGRDWGRRFVVGWAGSDSSSEAGLGFGDHFCLGSGCAAPVR